MCGICERIKETKEGKNPFLVKELETGYVVVGDFQHFKGYTLFLYKDHVVELFDLDENTRAKHLHEMTLVAEAVKNAFGAEKMNYECLGNGEGGAHIHWHLFPRRSGDIENYGNNGKGPVWWYPMDEMYADSNRPSSEELEEMKAKLLCELENLLQGVLPLNHHGADEIYESWHGGMNLLGKVDGYDNLIRVENEQAAAELLEMTDRILYRE